MMQIGQHDTTRDGTYVIAEIGVNHNGSPELARKLVDAAVAAGASAVKFQMYATDRLVSTLNRAQYDMLEKYELNAQQFLDLKQYCDRCGIPFLATPFDDQSADALERIGVPAFKIGSGDLTCHALLRQIATYRKPVLLSTGMATLGEIESALECLPGEVALLHCTSAYPAPYASLNLRALETLQTAFARPVGYSDHSEGIEVPLAAVSLGCRIVEKHFTLDRGLEGPDHQASLEPDSFQKMVNSIRNIEQSLGTARKTVTDAERNTLQKVRRGIYTRHDLPDGHRLSEQDLVYLRPVRGIEASAYKRIIGRRLLKAKNKFAPLRWNELGEGSEQ